MLTTHAVGIDLGTTYSCLAALNERGEPVTLPNEEGEQCTPSVVMYEDGEEIVGTEAWRSSISHPDRVVQNAKRFMGDPNKRWNIDGRSLSPIDVSASILRKLLRDARRQLGTIERAVITVPAQFSDLQRQATIQAGQQAGLKQVDIINEPVAAALCYVLGKEGLWFTELAEEQRILVYDLGGGTFDLSLVRYQQDEVKVIASSGDLHLGGLDWNQALLTAVADQFTREFKEDPRSDPESHQALAWEVEQCKRSLSTRPRASLICQHAGRRKTYQIEQQQFNQLTAPLVKRTEEITKQMLKDNRMGWAHVNVVLTTGGSSRMPMVRESLQKLSGRTLNTSLSPDQAIAHGAAYYAGMLISNNEFAKSILSEEAAARLAKVRQQSVSARGLGILVRDEKTMLRVPHYMIPANTPLPTSVTHTFGTVVPGQKRIVLRIVESGTGANHDCVEIGDCTIDHLPPDLPADSHVAVTISYDASATIHVSAKEVASGKEARSQILRVENVLSKPAPSEPDDDEAVVLAPVDETAVLPVAVVRPPPKRPVDQTQAVSLAATSAPRPPVKPLSAPVLPAVKSTPKPVPAPVKPSASRLEESAIPVPLCNECGEPLNSRGVCPACGPARAEPAAISKPAAPARPAPAAKSVASSRPASPVPVKPAGGPAPKPRPAPVPAAKPSPGKDSIDLDKIFEPDDDDDILELPVKRPAKPAGAMKPAGAPPKPAATPSKPAIKAPAPKPAAKPKPAEEDDAEFWRLPD